MNVEAEKAFPLCWPATWPRTASHKRRGAPFFVRMVADAGSAWRRKGKRSMADSCDQIIREVRSLGGAQLIISTNIELRNDGLPYSNRRSPDDQGAAFNRQTAP